MRIFTGQVFLRVLRVGGSKETESYLAQDGLKLFFYFFFFGWSSFLFFKEIQIKTEAEQTYWDSTVVAAFGR